MTSRTWLLKCFVLILLSCKTKHLRSLVRHLVLGLELIEILGLNLPFIIRISLSIFLLLFKDIGRQYKVT